MYRSWVKLHEPELLTNGWACPIYNSTGRDVERSESMDEDRNDDLIAEEERTSEEMGVDLNSLFDEDWRDLNRLFPDPRFRRFLRDMRRNQRDVERLLKGLESDGSIPEKPGGVHEVS
jgi:hypothetical protein